MKGANKLEPGDLIEIQPCSYSTFSDWEPAVFERAVNKEKLPNHYWVKLARTVWVAYANVIDEDSVSIYGRDAYQTDTIIVPARRIRRRKT